MKMRRVILLIGLLTAVLVLSAVAFWPTAGAATGKPADHSLIDQTGGDTNVRCRTTNGRPFIVYGSFRAFGGDVTMRVRFRDGDFVEYPLAANEVFSFQQAAGSTARVDTRIIVEKSGGSGSLVGWLSAARAPGSRSLVVCSTN
jgi:hypothetical protein